MSQIDFKALHEAYLRRHPKERSGDAEMSPSEWEFTRAVDEYRRANRRHFPSSSEVLQIALALGYRRLAPPGQARAVEETLGGTAVQRLELFFRARDNAPATVAEMAEGARIPLKSLRGFVYRRHAAKFHRVRGDRTRWQWAALAPSNPVTDLAPPQLVDVPRLNCADVDMMEPVNMEPQAVS